MGQRSANNRQIWRDSKLISTSDNLIWICWDAIRRLAKVDYNAGDITIYAIRKSDADATDLIRADACELLSQLSGSGVQQAIDFSSASSEHFYFKQIPAHYIETKMVFNLQVSLSMQLTGVIADTSAIPRLVALRMVLDPSITSPRKRDLGSYLRSNRSIQGCPTKDQQEEVRTRGERSRGD